MKHCRPLQPLGHGSTGVVFLAHLLPDTPDDHHRQTPPISDSADEPSTPLVAIKAFSKARRGCLRRSHNEEQVLSKLTNQSAPHPFLPTLHSSFEDAEFRYLVLDYCAGGDLNSLRYTLPDKRFSCAAIRFYAAEIVLALEHLHQEGIVYRDLKPENILLSFNGHIMLTDFDLSAILPPKSNLSPLPEQASMERRSKSHKLQAGPSGGSHRVMPDASYGSMEAHKGIARCHSFVGTDDYVAPEVIESKGHEFAVDWWALGILLYEMVYGRAPFKGVNSRETFRNIIHKELELCGLSSPLRDLIIKLLVKEPHLRLGYRCGAAEIKAHPFFLGVQWEALQDVLRPPFIPNEPDVVAPHKPFDLRAHLLEVECIRIEERARKKLARKLALE